MPGGGYGGDNSVRWFIDSENVRDGTAITRPISSKGLHFEGIDETSSGQSFRLTIMLPRNATQRDAFLSSLGASLGVDLLRVEALKTQDAVVCTLPIEDKSNGGANWDQIQVYWPAPTGATT